ncbi:MAG: amidohydrolase family protein [Eubacteriales bacterium]
MKKFIITQNLIDGKSNNPIKDQVIIIKGDKIEALKPLGSMKKSEMLPDSTYEVNYILPGFIDSHNHLAADIGDQEDQKRQHMTYRSLRVARNARKDLLSGVTTMRTTGETEEIDFAYRRAFKEWIVPGPRVLASGTPIGVTGSHGWTFLTEQVDGPEAMRNAVRRRRRAGADFIKLMVSGGMMTPNSDYMMAEITLEELRAATEEAKRWGKRTAAHIAGGQALDFAIEVGIDSIEHGFFATEEQLKKMYENGQFLVATVNDVKIYGQEGDKYGVPIYAQEKCRASFGPCCETMSKAREIGVKIAIGQDCNHGNFAEEMFSLVKYAKFSEMDIIKSATIIGAETCGIEQVIGTIEAGKFADIIGLENDPTSDIGALKQISFVMKEGIACLYNYQVFI